MKAHRKNSLFYTKSGELDTGQFVLLVCCVVGMGVFVGIALNRLVEPSIAAWSFFGTFTTMCFIAGAAKDRAVLIANSKAMGEVSHGIASQTVVVPPMQWTSGDPDAGKM